MCTSVASTVKLQCECEYGLRGVQVCLTKLILLMTMSYKAFQLIFWELKKSVKNWSRGKGCKEQEQKIQGKKYLK